MKPIKILGSLVASILSANVLATEWSYSSEVDEFTDTTVHIALVTSLDTNGFVIAKCDEEKKFELYLSVDEFIGSQDTYKVRYRIDKNSPESDEWNVSTEGTSVFARYRDKLYIAREFMSGTQLLVEVTDFHGTPHQSKYSLNGATNAIGQVLDACGKSREAVDIEGVSVSVKKHISILGPKATLCKKKELTTLGYVISDESSDKSPDVYKALQKYMDDKSAICGTRKAKATDEVYCENKEWFLNKLYGDAKKKDKSLKKTCGHVKSNE